MTRTMMSLLVLAAAPVIAAEPLCCKLFGFDASSLLGSEAATCGRIVTADAPNQARDESSEERQRATQCALDAQSRGRAFVYTYRVLASPDIDMLTQAVFGAHGERMLLRMGLNAGENIRRVDRCESLLVQPDGLLKAAGCVRVD
jgi:hypothetical protein